ncbi:MAG TPA: hypothetical protein VG826_04365 [Pirellulales bacterium]|nr:hypothetical protein [Pirellulales bacterium]
MAIQPRIGLELRSERPAIIVSPWQRLLGRLLRRFILQRIESQRAKEWARLKPLLALARKCSNRDELESLLGAPRYAMHGELFGTSHGNSQVEHPDLVEVYEIGRYVVELWFKGERIWSLASYLALSPWEIAALPR